MTFCEAVNQSFKIPLRINPCNLNCLGARRSIGFETNDKLLIKEIAVHSNLSGSFIASVLPSIPALRGIRHINLGLTEQMEAYYQTDLYIAYVQPYKITELMHNLARLEICPSIPCYSFLSVCGNIFANCYLNQVPCLSFGCVESRNHGGIGKNEIVLGLPVKTACRLLDNYRKSE